MESNSFKIKGGRKLSGEITPQGAKNEALQILCATLLTEEEVKVNNIPGIIDIKTLIEILAGLGVKISKGEENTLIFQAKKINTNYLYSEEFKNSTAKLRGALMIAGPMLARYGVMIIPRPGGDKIGVRSIDTHLRGLEKLGVNFIEKEGIYEGSVDKLKGAYIYLEEPSVTGTANIIMASVLADGETTIYNAACEPYIKQLCRMLISMGADINGTGTNQLIIRGVKKLGGCHHTILPDMIEIGSFIGLAAMVGDGIRIKNVAFEELGIIPRTFEKLGITIIQEGDDIVVPAHGHYEIQKQADGNIPTIYDAPWPGLTPDLLSIILITATQARGSLLIHHKMFERRLFFVDGLIDMGAQIILCDPHRAVIVGLDKEKTLIGTKLNSPDIRAGMALLIAALSAKGESVIQNVYQIDRGYEKIEERLNALGAEITRM